METGHSKSLTRFKTPITQATLLSRCAKIIAIFWRYPSLCIALTKWRIIMRNTIEGWYKSSNLSFQLKEKGGKTAPHYHNIRREFLKQVLGNRSQQSLEG